MKRSVSAFLSALLGATLVPAQDNQRPQAPQQEEVVRITSRLVTTDVVVVDKKDQPVSDLKLDDFELYENGKKQTLQLVELIDTGARAEDQTNSRNASLKTPADSVNVSGGRGGSAVNRYIAFVVDDLTIPLEDFDKVRKTLLDFVDNRMTAGQLVAILRTSGSKGLFNQFTSDRQLLKKAITELTPRLHPLNSFNNPDEKPTRVESGRGVMDLDAKGPGPGKSTDAMNLYMRARLALTVANHVIDSLSLAPGRKDLVLLSGGLPVLGHDASPEKILTDATNRASSVPGSTSNDVNTLIRQMTDNAARAGVVVSTLYIRGLVAGGVASFKDTPAQSSLGLGLGEPGFGRSADETRLGGNKPFNSMDGQLGLSSLADATGGVAVANTNNFAAGLDRVLGRGQVYYVLAYVPTEKFDNTFHRLQVKVNRPGSRVYARLGFYAADNPPWLNLSKEETILRAAASPVKARSMDLASYVHFRFLPGKKVSLEVQLAVEVSQISFQQVDGRFNAAVDLVGLVYDESGRLRAGFSGPSALSLTPAEYQRALANGWEVSGNADLVPGGYELRAAVRDQASGAVGILEKYFEIPNVSTGEINVSTIFLYEVAPPPATEAPASLTALRRVSRQRDLRYAALVYNPKLDGGRYRLRVQAIISHSGKVIYQGPERALEGNAEPDSSRVMAMDQLKLAGVQPSSYVLTLVVIDTLSKKNQTVSRSVDFTVVK